MTNAKQQQKHNPVIREPFISRKVVIVGAGDVGASFAYALLQSGISEILVLIDANSELANGQALDLAHGLPFVPATIVRTAWPRNRVFGSGTVLDSARFRHLIGAHCGVGAKSVHASILGEHGDSEVAAWSLTHIAGVSMDDYCSTCHQCYDWKMNRERIVTEARDSAYHIIDAKGSTCYAIGLALVQIVGGRSSK